MLQPKKVKHRKVFKGRMRGKAYRGSTLSFGEYGLQATEQSRVTARQIEAARVAMTRYVKRGGKVWIRIFPDKPITKKPAETRMGKGKGPPEYWVAVIRPGRILYEMEGIPEELAREAMLLAAHKLPLRTRFVSRQVIGHAAAVGHRMGGTSSQVRECEGKSNGAADLRNVVERSIDGIATVDQRAAAGG